MQGTPERHDAWDPERYERFRARRERPALDLFAPYYDACPRILCSGCRPG